MGGAIVSSPFYSPFPLPPPLPSRSTHRQTERTPRKVHLLFLFPFSFSPPLSIFQVSPCPQPSRREESRKLFFQRFPLLLSVTPPSFRNRRESGETLDEDGRSDVSPDATFTRPRDRPLPAKAQSGPLATWGAITEALNLYALPPPPPRDPEPGKKVGLIAARGNFLILTVHAAAPRCALQVKNYQKVFFSGRALSKVQ